MKNNFIDYIKIFCKSGDGGSGCIHFFRDKFNFRGKPDGGAGGKGGDIIIKGNSNVNTFLHLRYHKHWVAPSGNPGKKNNITGLSGQNVYIDVPIGTVIKNEYKDVIAEVKKDFQKIVIIKGGIGGKGNSYFKHKTRGQNNYAQSGIKTIGKWIILELKILADIGIIGFPNSGKSTLLSSITNANPKIGNFPFTNTIPNLGVVKINFDSLLLADIPGIIEKASEGKGLGLNFLRHIERNKILLILISSEEKEKKKQYFILLNELKKFNIDLLHKKRILAISKSDLIHNSIDKINIYNIFHSFEKHIIFISSFTKEGLKELCDKFMDIIK